MPEFDVLRACVCGPGAEGPVQSKLPQERSGWVRLSGISLCLKRLVSRQIVLWMPCQTVLSRPHASRPAFLSGLFAILIYTVSSQFQPMPLLKRAAPFDDPDWLFELKMDGFRALAIVEHGRAQLLSRNGHPFASFSALAESISDSLPNARAVIDGEICSLDRRGKP